MRQEDDPGAMVTEMVNDCKGPGLLPWDGHPTARQDDGRRGFHVRRSCSVDDQWDELLCYARRSNIQPKAFVNGRKATCSSAGELLYAADDAAD